MSDEIGPEQARINAHSAAVKAEIEALQKGKVEEAVERVDDYLRQHLPEDTVVDTTALARRAVNAARSPEKMT